MLDSLTADIEQFSRDPEALARAREGQCFPTIEELDKTFGTEKEYIKLKDKLAVTSSYFRARIWVSIGTTEFTLYSLLNRSSTGLVRPVLRSFGTS